ncbi:MAG TPA: 4-alpha-glucanotransferase, partial [Parachlamydiaceae bacterium]|nr:4-alpha-glucanotransferase [Parachlamydiaceae bacterium]
MDDTEIELKSTPAAGQWERIGIKHHHGINLPLFALHSKNSAGIGEFPDLIPLLSWCNSLDLDVVQLLPLNDTGEDTSPYGALSAFALNPLHLGLSALPNVDSNPILKTMLKEAQKLTYCQRIPYHQLHVNRNIFLKAYFQEHSESIIESEGYKKFAENNPWVKGYALFKSIRKECNWQSWENWPEEIKNPSENSLKQLTEKYEVQVSYHQVIQYLCFEQMKAVKAHADSLGIFLKGDLPILINSESADVWLNRRFFNMELSAGAPPDHYSDDGQNWGFPLYNWDEMGKDGFKWWKERLSVASNFYHIYRLDHVVGFYRIWGIAKGEKSKNGWFIPQEEQLWIPQGEKILSAMLQESSMLPIGEDLGNIPNEVRQNLQDLGVCGTKVMRWERNWEGDSKFIPLDAYPALSMTTVSTHDSAPLSLWWVQ